MGVLQRDSVLALGADRGEGRGEGIDAPKSKRAMGLSRGCGAKADAICGAAQNLSNGREGKRGAPREHQRDRAAHLGARCAGADKLGGVPPFQAWSDVEAPSIRTPIGGENRAAASA